MLEQGHPDDRNPGKPVIYADFQFGGSGGFLVYNAAMVNAGNRKVGFVASSSMMI